MNERDKKIVSLLSMITRKKDACANIVELYSKQISDAIEPLNVLTAPFILVTLEMYRQELEKIYPEAVPLAKAIERTHGRIIISTNPRVAKAYEREGNNGESG